MNPTRALALVAVLLLTSAAATGENPAGIPKEYKLLYSQDFEKPEAIKDFALTDPSAWTVNKGSLELTKQSDYKPPHRSPFNIALVKGKVFGDGVLEAECLQTGKEYGHRDMVFVFGYQSPAKYYYVHIATKADDHANNVFLVKDAPRVKIAKETNAGNNWGLDVWHKVRVERRASDGTVKVYFDDLKKPIMVAEDKTFGAGWIGFGSFDDTGRVRNVRVWGPSAEDKLAPAFGK
jgi:hypothetical protein